MLLKIFSFSLVVYQNPRLFSTILCFQNHPIQDTGGIVGPAVGNSPWPWGKQEVTFEGTKDWWHRYTPEVEQRVFPWKNDGFPIGISPFCILFYGVLFSGAMLICRGCTSMIWWWNRLFSLKTLGALILKPYSSLFNSSQLHYIDSSWWCLGSYLSQSISLYAGYENSIPNDGAYWPSLMRN